MELNNETLTHLLGYLKPEQWGDALKQNLDNELINELIMIQDKTYGGGIAEEIKNAIREEKECFRCGHKWFTAKPLFNPNVCPKCKSPYWDLTKKEVKEMDKPILNIITKKREYLARKPNNAKFSAFKSYKKARKFAGRNGEVITAR